MDALRGHFAALKLRGVETFIASGNVIFETATTDLAALERKIERHLAAELGYDVPTMLRSMAELATVGGHRPFSSGDMENETNSLNVLFLRAAPPAEVARAVAALNGAKDEFRLKGREIYWLCRGKISVDSLAAPLMGKALKGCECTVRNLRTVRQMVGLYGEAPGGKAAKRVSCVS